MLSYQTAQSGRFIFCLQKHGSQRALQFWAEGLTSTVRIKSALYQSFHNQAIFCIYIPRLLLLKVSFVLSLKVIHGIKC